MLVGSALVATVAWGRLDSRLLLLLVGYACALGLLGFLDDLTKLRSGRKGLRARTKLLVQLAVSLLVGGCLYLSPLEVEFPAAGGNAGTCVFFPFFKDHYIQLGVGFVLLVTCVTTGASNAVNLTDGLDGLAIGLTIICARALTVLAYIAGHREFAEYLDVARVPQAAELTIFCGSMVGASLAFLWYNAHPAEIFMGDVGSLGLGGALATVAVLVKQEILLLFVGGVFVVEALSVILQVGSFKLRGKRIFKMAPLHHHFEALGWPESKIIARFWIAGLVWALFALSTLKLR